MDGQWIELAAVVGVSSCCQSFFLTASVSSYGKAGPDSFIRCMVTATAMHGNPVCFNGQLPSNSKLVVRDFFPAESSSTQEIDS